MHIDIGDAITAPMESDEWLKTVLIGGLLLLFSFLIVPAFVVLGYGVRLIRERIGGAEAPPVFDDWGELLVDGIKAFVIWFLYYLIPLIVFGVTAGGALASAGVGMDPAAVIAQVGAGLAIAGLLSLVFTYVGVAGFVNFAQEGSLADGFAFGRIWNVITETGYLVAWLLAIVVAIVGNVIIGILGIIPILGQIVGVFVLFYVYLIMWRLWADGYAAARDIDASTGETAVEDVTP